MRPGKHDIDPPASSEFGSGPRTSIGGKYATTLLVQAPLRLREMQTLRVLVENTGGRSVDSAAITVEGGMSQHGHGLPTSRRVTGYLGDGIYEIGGVRFNMGGWWKFRLMIDGSAGNRGIDAAHLWRRIVSGRVPR